mmetsp:Transcript_12987/g.24770  ORF Transcript_12987/g.24770 Transcript_12987/m.24770 type:complete len:213 (-) Transcript_12987:833-1471(-)
MILEDGAAALQVRERHRQLAIQPARTSQRGVQHVWQVGRRQQHHVAARLEAVEFREQLGQRGGGRGGGGVVVAARAHRVQLVHKHHARGPAPGSLEKVTDAGGAHAHVLLLKARPRLVEEGHPRLPRHRARQQRLASSRRPNHQQAGGKLRPQPLELLRVFQILHQLLQLAFGLVHAVHVAEESARAGRGFLHRRHFFLGWRSKHVRKQAAP